ncbi:hypothetical protein L211DRAFT_882247 [Terfezia boudieri ATCC MYA-4762]|uniref:Uncharacterized protein n=1 Tax=Terfezia boudieri ATCC MYA-4762 TaxID=1051890 RepID=A0A3N4M265_9PEZI|nr:hypothetical protein L211DRAFT_882247 [Terfezia boudieri ATCC MYA-4762]
MWGSGKVRGLFAIFALDTPEFTLSISNYYRTMDTTLFGQSAVSEEDYKHCMKCQLRRKAAIRQAFKGITGETGHRSIFFGWLQNANRNLLQFIVEQLRYIIASSLEGGAPDILPSVSMFSRVSGIVDNSSSTASKVTWGQGQRQTLGNSHGLELLYRIFVGASEGEPF